ncbi:MAG: DUF5665 domain-containing protein [Bacillota bacterium]|jgi:hypothetical protein
MVKREKVKEKIIRKISKADKWAEEVKVYDDKVLDAAVDEALSKVVVRPRDPGEEKFSVKADTEYLNSRPIGEIVDELNAENADTDKSKSYLEVSDLEKAERLTFAMNRLSLLLEKSRFSDYVLMMSSTKQLMYKQFWAGIARGVGYGIGFLLLAAIAIYILQAVASWGLPYIGDFIARLLEYINDVESYKHGLTIFNYGRGLL